MQRVGTLHLVLEIASLFSSTRRLIARSSEHCKSSQLVASIPTADLVSIFAIGRITTSPIWLSWFVRSRYTPCPPSSPLRMHHINIIAVFSGYWYRYASRWQPHGAPVAAGDGVSHNMIAINNQLYEQSMSLERQNKNKRANTPQAAVPFELNASIT